MFNKKHIERYILGALLPYALLALVILTFVLLAQQFSKFAEIMGAARAPFRLALEVTSYLLPTVLVFTLPMAVLVGTATGFCKLGSDSELTAIRAAGVGTLRVIAPVLILGVFGSCVALYVAFELAPASAVALRDAALRAAIHKLESPVEPKSFYTELPGKVIYVRDGDPESGQWGRVFIHWQEDKGQLRLITARAGRIDMEGERTELVLTDARVTTLPRMDGSQLSAAGAVTTEHSAQLRLRDDRLSAARAALSRRVREREAEPDEMSWGQLLEASRGGEDLRIKLLVQTALHKRLALSLAPLALAVLGAGMGLRVRRGGRAFGVGLSLFAMLLYYLLSLAGEQLARSGAVSPIFALWVPFSITLFTGLLLLWTPALSMKPILRPIRFPIPEATFLKGDSKRLTDWKLNRSFIRGLLNKSVLSDLTRYFVLTFIVLTVIFLVFTLFELLRFIVINSASGELVGRYLFFLLPLVSVTVAPMSMLLAVLITYSLMVRRSELVAWWGSGQSIYRVVMPAFFFAMAISGCFWVLQERVMPEANKRQNRLRAQIRGGLSRLEVSDGKQWLAMENPQRIYSYVFELGRGHLKNTAVYEFDSEGVHLKRAWWSDLGYWRDPDLHLTFQTPLVVEFNQGKIATVSPPSVMLEGTRPDVFKPSLNNPAEMDSKALSAYIKALKARELPTHELTVALERKRASILDPLIMVLVGAPAAMAFGRRSTILALCSAVFLGLFFWGVVSTFGHLGAEGILQAKIAAWVPSFLFSAVGTYLLLRIQT